MKRKRGKNYSSKQAPNLTLTGVVKSAFVACLGSVKAPRAGAIPSHC